MTEQAVFVVDLNLCTGCRACELACGIANRLPADRVWRTVRTYNPLHAPGIELFHLSMACNHCADAPCLEQCPAGAYRRDGRTGAVLIDTGACLGCRYCAWVCPYDAPRFDPGNGVMTKCDFCNDRLLQGGVPACVTACPTGALEMIRSAEPAAATTGIPGLTRQETRPSLQVRPLRPERRTPRLVHPPAMPPLAPLRDALQPLISLRAEWPLAVFTLLAAALVGVFGAVRAGAARPDWRIFLAAGIGGLLLSAWHLGRRSRAWRAVRQPQSSGLSREIILFSVFLGAATLALRLTPLPLWIASAVLLLGLLMLVAVDRVYAPVRLPGPSPLHSALTLLTGLTLAAAWQSSVILLTILSVLKGGLYLARKIPDRDTIGISVLRILLLLGGGLWIARAGPEIPGLMLLIAGEIIDRLEYYREMAISGPESLMLDDLEARTTG